MKCARCGRKDFESFYFDKYTNKYFCPNCTLEIFVEIKKIFEAKKI